MSKGKDSPSYHVSLPVPAMTSESPPKNSESPRSSGTLTSKHRNKSFLVANDSLQSFGITDSDDINKVDELPPKLQSLAELMFYVSIGDCAQVELIARGYNIDITSEKTADYDKRTPLHIAADSGSYACASWLVKENAPPNVVDRFGNTPLDCAIRSGHYTIAGLLEAHGGAKHAQGELVTADLGIPAEVAQHMRQHVWSIPREELKLMDKLGEGAFGTVHSAKWRGTDVCVKQVKPELFSDGQTGGGEDAVKEFEQEVGLMTNVHHPHCVQFLGCDLDRKPYMLVTELLPRGSLADTFRTTTTFSTRRAAEVARDMARGMAYLHGRKPRPIVHRDLKPGNLMFTASGKLKVGDFGLSKTLQDRAYHQQRLTESYEMTGETGSYRYMAPEVFRHEAYGMPVDVYAFSMITYQCFTWCTPFGHLGAVDACKQAALQHLRPDLEAIPKSTQRAKIQDLLKKCWAPDPPKRPPFTAVIEKLDKIINALPNDTAQNQSACCVIT